MKKIPRITKRREKIAKFALLLGFLFVWIGAYAVAAASTESIEGRGSKGVETNIRDQEATTTSANDDELGSEKPQHHQHGVETSHEVTTPRALAKTAGRASRQTCRCEYPGEGIYNGRRSLTHKLTTTTNRAATKGRKRKPATVVNIVSTRYNVVEGVTVLPASYCACQGLKYVCADTNVDGPLWNYDCSGSGSSDLVGYVVVLPADYSLCQCRASPSRFGFDTISGGGSSTESTGKGSKTTKKGSKSTTTTTTTTSTSTKKGRSIFSPSGKNRGLIRSDMVWFGKHRSLKGSKSAKSPPSPAPPVIAPRFYSPLRCSYTPPDRTPAPSYATDQPTANIIVATQRPSKSPTMYPTEVTSCPTPQPTAAIIVSTFPPTTKPTRRPTCLRKTKQPSTQPSVTPSTTPSAQPTAAIIVSTFPPTPRPTERPTCPDKTKQPSMQPSATPSTYPSTTPSSQPTAAIIISTFPPTPRPTERPTCPDKTKYPTMYPTETPSTYPTITPSSQPTAAIIVNTLSPSSEPTRYKCPPTQSHEPTAQPTAQVIVATPSPSRSTDFPTMDFYDVNEELTCIAVLSRTGTSADALETNWNEFRKTYPLRSFCLLQPEPNPKSDLKVPVAFDQFVNATYAQVHRDNGVTNDVSDWFDICGLSRLQRQGITKVAISIDTPNLKATSNFVRASYELFVIKLAAQKISLIHVQERQDDNWVAPFLHTFL